MQYLISAIIKLTRLLVQAKDPKTVPLMKATTSKKIFAKQNVTKPEKKRYAMKAVKRTSTGTGIKSISTLENLLLAMTNAMAKVRSALRSSLTAQKEVDMTNKIPVDKLAILQQSQKTLHLVQKSVRV